MNFSTELARSCCWPKQCPLLSSIFQLILGLRVKYDIGTKQHVLTWILSNQRIFFSKFWTTHSSTQSGVWGLKNPHIGPLFAFCIFDNSTWGSTIATWLSPGPWAYSKCSKTVQVRCSCQLALYSHWWIQEKSAAIYNSMCHCSDGLSATQYGSGAGGRFSFWLKLNA